jgi:hypothetical protein
LPLQDLNPHAGAGDHAERYVDRRNLKQTADMIDSVLSHTFAQDGAQSLS